MEYREKIEYLESYVQTLEQEIDLYDQIKAAQDTATVHGMQITEGIHSNDVHSAVESVSIRIEDLQDKYNKTVAERKAIREYIEQAADRYLTHFCLLISKKAINMLTLRKKVIV